MTSFKTLGLSNDTLKALTDLGFEKPSEIQLQAIPHLLTGETDFIGLAQTGTGKTAAFGIPLLERIDPHVHHTQALILAPTRELGKQIGEQLQLFSKYMSKINVTTVYGGAAISNQIKALKKPQHIIIATPGRLIDLIGRKAVKLDHLQYLVLDEADEMLNMGFKDEIDEILRHTPAEKFTWLFSATMPAEIKRIVNTYMRAPHEVRIEANTVNANIEHRFAVMNHSDKTEALTRFMDVDPDMRGVVFCRTKRDTQALAEQLLRKNYKADALHGDMSQVQRDRVMRRFKDHELQLLIATDVAARGIDVDNLTHVFHYSLPDDTSYYTHRSGRTARAGKKGISVAFITGREKHMLNRIAKYSGIVFDPVVIPDADDVALTRIDNRFKKIADQNPGKRNKNEKLKERAHEILEGLSKEEITDKLVAMELEKIKTDTDKNLNAKIEDRAPRGGGKGGKRRGGPGGKFGKGGGKGDFKFRGKSKYGSKKKSDFKKKSGRQPR